MKANKFLIASGMGICGLIFLGCLGASGLGEEQIGLRKSSLFSENENLVAYNYSAEAAGSSKLIERSFENAPPMISHDVSDMFVITKDNNMCLACHSPENAEATMSVSVPKTHLVDLRRNKDLKGQIDDARFNCSACHVPQVNAAPLVNNNFRPDFRQESSQQKSNLIDVLNEGVQ